MVEEVRLRVVEAKPRDAGRGKARIDDETMRALNVVAGDVISIKGQRITGAIAWPAYQEDAGKNIIQIDGLVRKNAGVALGEYVTVAKIDAAEAKSVVLAPVDMRLNVDFDFKNFVKSRLLETPLVEGDSVFAVVLGSAVPFIVRETEPKGVVKMGPMTDLQVLSKPEKRLLRFAWLKKMEKRCASDYTKFRVPELIEDDKEEPVLEEAKRKAKDTNEPVKVFVDFWEKRGRIDSIAWALIKPDGAIEYIYEERIERITSAVEDVVRFISSTLKDHEKQLDDIGSRLEAFAEKLKAREEKKE